MTIGTAIDDIRVWLANPERTDEERLEIFREIADGYCVHCGRKLTSDHDYCHCTNDE